MTEEIDTADPEETGRQVTDPESVVDAEASENSVYEYYSTLDPHHPRVADVLSHGEIEILGQMPWSSNVVLLANVALDEDVVPAVHKPERGERPLWDFPPSLWKREIAFFELAKLMGFRVVPPTVTRNDGPYGPGSLQVFIPADHNQHYFTLIEHEEHHEQLQQICLLDLVANSTDRKGGHCLIDDDKRIWAIDNALSFHEDPKLRTVIWDFAGRPFSEDYLERLHGLIATDLHAVFQGLLSGREISTITDRAAALIDLGRFPTDATKSRYPWPLV